MGEDEAQYRAGRVVFVLSHDETCELRMLFSQMSHTCDVACDTLGKAGPAPLGSELQRFKELTAHLSASLTRIHSIIG